jgi:hypothetical protein
MMDGLDVLEKHAFAAPTAVTLLSTLILHSFSLIPVVFL